MLEALLAPSPSLDGCQLRQRACETVCATHTTRAKLIRVMDVVREGLMEDFNEDDLYVNQQRGVDPRSWRAHESHESNSHVSRQSRLAGIEIGLDKLLPYANTSGFTVNLVHLETFSHAQRSLSAPVSLAEDAAVLETGLPHARHAWLAPHRGFFMGTLSDMTLVHDSVICNATHTLTTFATKHSWHPATPHGCAMDDAHELIKHITSALVLVRYMGWFWGHFMQDVLHRLAFAQHVIEKRNGSPHFKILMESRTHGNVLALVQALLGADVNERVLFVPTACLRGNARSCSYYYRVHELILVETYPDLVNTLASEDDTFDVVPHGVYIARRRISAYFDGRFHEQERSHSAFTSTNRGPVGGGGYMGECSAAKTAPLTRHTVTGKAITGSAPFRCGKLQSWLTSQVQHGGRAEGRGGVGGYRVVYLGRGVSPCQEGRTRCIRNAAQIVTTLEQVSRILSYLHITPASSASLSSAAAGAGGRHSQKSACF